MQTVNEHAFKNECLRRIKSEPGLQSILEDCAAKMNSGFFTDGLHDWPSVFVQKWRGGYDIYDAFCFSNLWARATNKEIVCIPLGRVPPPSRDSDLIHNDGVLSALDPPFEGEFRGGPGDNDGFISWNEPLDAGPEYSRKIPPGRLPLEVGTTAAWNTWMHWYQEGGVARWPYRSEIIYLIIAVNGIPACSRASPW